jgi:hypothetical protein
LVFAIADVKNRLHSTNALPLIAVDQLLCCLELQI